MVKRKLLKALLATVALCLLTACAGIKSISPATRAAIARADTVYVLPSAARYSTKGLIFNRTDSARTQRLRARLDSLMVSELSRLLPGAVVVAGDSADPKVLEGVHVRMHARAFRRTVPRQAFSDVSDILLLIPTFGRSMATPILPASKLRLEITRPERRAPRFYHEDEVNADDPAELIFQVRKLLDAGYRG